MLPGVMKMGFLPAVYNAVSRLRKRACEIPEPSGKASTLDFTSMKQDVVQIAIEPEHTPAELVSMEKNCSLYLDNSHTIEIEANGNHKTPCTESSCGRMFYLYPEKNCVLIPGTLRGTPEWDSIYKIRVNVENQSTISRAAFVLPVAKPETKNFAR